MFERLLDRLACAQRPQQEFVTCTIAVGLDAVDVAHQLQGYRAHFTHRDRIIVAMWRIFGICTARAAILFVRSPHE